jgi:hypothetical protein
MCNGWSDFQLGNGDEIRSPSTLTQVHRAIVLKATLARYTQTVQDFCAAFGRVFSGIGDPAYSPQCELTD